MSRQEIDAYLSELDDPKRSTLEHLRLTILEVVPDAAEGISYKVPAFRTGSKVFAGFAAFKDHLSYLPFSGSVLDKLRDELAGFDQTKSALHFPIDQPLPKSLVRKLVEIRMSEIKQG